MKNSRKMQNVVICIIVIGWVAALGCRTAMAEGGNKSMVLPLAMENFPPFEFEQDGKIVGSDTEIIVQVLERLGYIPRIEVLPWKRAQEYVKTGKMAALYSLTKTPEREKFYYFSDPLSTVEDVFFKLKAKKISWEALEDLKNYRVSVSSGYSYAPVFMDAMAAKIFHRIDIVTGDQPELRHLKKVKAGRTDLCICEVSVCQYLIKTHAPEFDMLDYIDRPIGKIRPYFIGFSKKWPGAENLVERFNAELARFVAEGGRKVVFEKYGVTSPLEK